MSVSLRKLLEQGDRAAARSSAEERLKANPGDVEALATLAKLALEVGDLAKAEALISQVTPSERADYDVGLVEAMVCAQRGQGDVAEARYRELASAKASRAEAHFGLGFLLFGAGRAEEALEPLTKAVRYAPEAWANHFYLGGAQLKCGKLKPGLGHLKRALELNPLHPPIYLAWSSALQSLGKLDEAEALLREGLKLVPNHPSLLRGLAAVLSARKDLRAALEVIVRAAEVAPGDAGIVTDLARLRLAHGDYQLALELTDELIRSGRESAEVWMIRALAFESRPTPDVQAAASAYRRAVELDPAGWAPANNLGLLLSQLSERDASLVGEAKAVLQEAVRRAPDRVESKLNLAILLGRTGDSAAARRLAQHVASAAHDAGLKEQAERLLTHL